MSTGLGRFNNLSKIKYILEEEAYVLCVLNGRFDVHIFRMGLAHLFVFTI
jgi:hypothetical protein